ncbi:MAG: transposase [Ferrimicrobium sp.]
MKRNYTDRGGGVEWKRSAAPANNVESVTTHAETCSLAEKCTTSKIGRKIRIGANEAALAGARKEQADPTWKADYRATRPKVERKFGNLMRCKHGSRRARVRGLLRVGNDFSLLAGAANLARLAKLEVRSNTYGGWEVAT